MTDRDIMKQALEALENLQGLCTDAQDGWVEAVTIWTPEIITALRERLAQPEQDAVLAEREACAALVDANAMACHSPIYRSLLQSNAQAIRERGKT